MFKRANKVTALLVAAASVMATVPAMAADTVRLGTKDGYVNEGVSFKNGQYAYYGYRTDDSDTGIYYNSGSSSDKDQLVKDTEDYQIDRKDGKYGDKYLEVKEDGNHDDYLIDLTTGKIADVDSVEDQQATAEAKLISQLKKTERYDTLSDGSYSTTFAQVQFQRLFNNQFGDVWYQYVTSSSAASNVQPTMDLDNGVVITPATTSASIPSYFGFTNNSGKYIDSSKLANIKVYDLRKEKSVDIAKFATDYKDEALRADLVQLKALAQDKDNIYALAKVQVTYYGAKAADGTILSGDQGKYTKADGSFNKDAANAYTTFQYFVQKISKAQGTTTDGAYLPKSVDSWIIDGGTGASTGEAARMFEKKGERQDAFDYLVGDLTGKKSDGSSVAQNANKFSVTNGALNVIDLNDDDSKMHVYKLKFKKDKLDLDGGALYRAIDNVDVNVVTTDEDDSTDKINWDWSIDVDGNVWALDNGEIKEFDGKNFVTKYKTDRGFYRLDVYDSGNLIAWDNKDGDVGGAYTTVQEGKQQTVTDGKVVDPNLIDKTTVKTGWDKLADGTWNFYDATGAKVTNNWVNVGGVWYFLKADGVMASGWQQVGTTWYYLASSGAMQTGWVNDGGTWYYMAGSGAMQTGWVNDGGTWYYMQSNGAMAHDTTVDGYVLGSNGAWIQ